jgi:hypothetical protein
MGECKTETTVLIETIDPHTLQSKFEYGGTIQASLNVLVMLSSMNKLPLGITFQRGVIARWGYTAKLVCMDTQGKDIKYCVKKLNAFLNETKRLYREAV